jgi:hypothetical protein
MSASARLDQSATLLVSSELMTTGVGSDVVVLDLRDGVYYSLADVGARIWALLQSPVTMAAIQQRIVSEYDVDEGRCAGDVQSLVRALLDRGLIEMNERR